MQQNYLEHAKFWHWPAHLLLPASMAFLLLLVGLFMIYFSPSTNAISDRAPLFRTTEGQHQNIKIGGRLFRIPENHIRPLQKEAQKDSAEVLLHALLPDFKPYQKSNWREFENNGASSPVILIKIQSRGLSLPSAQRLEHLYKSFFNTDPPQESYDGLEQQSFRKDSLYKNQDLHVGEDSEGRLVLFLCFHESFITPAPSCSRTFLLDDTSITYRFKRERLSDWRQMDRRLRIFISSLMPESP